MIIAAGTTLYQALEEEDFPLPPECADVKLLMPADGLFQLQYTVNLHGEDLEALGRALTKVGQSTMRRQNG